MGFILKDVWKRKDLVHPDAEEQVARKLANTHPYNIRWDAAKFADYGRLYGQAEADVLSISVASGKYDMVESYQKAWVQNGHFVAADPVPQPSVTDPNHELKPSPFGTVVVDKNTGAIIHQGDIGTLDLQQAEAFFDKVVMACLERAGLVKS